VKKTTIAVFALLLVVLAAIPVFAWEYPDLPMPDENNVGCSAKSWYWESVGVTFGKLKGFDLEEAVALANADAFKDDLTVEAIGAVRTAYEAASKAEQKGYVEYLKLWNKGYLDEDGVLVKTCPKQ
jgi:hypothetical protein